MAQIWIKYMIVIGNLLLYGLAKGVNGSWGWPRQRSGEIQGILNNSLNSLTHYSHKQFGFLKTPPNMPLDPDSSAMADWLNEIYKNQTPIQLNFIAIQPKPIKIQQQKPQIQRLEHKIGKPIRHQYELVFSSQRTKQSPYKQRKIKRQTPIQPKPIKIQQQKPQIQRLEHKIGKPIRHQYELVFSSQRTKQSPYKQRKIKRQTPIQPKPIKIQQQKPQIQRLEHKIGKPIRHQYELVFSSQRTKQSPYKQRKIKRQTPIQPKPIKIQQQKPQIQRLEHKIGKPIRHQYELVFSSQRTKQSPYKQRKIKRQTPIQPKPIKIQQQKPQIQRLEHKIGKPIRHQYELVFSSQRTKQSPYKQRKIKRQTPIQPKPIKIQQSKSQIHRLKPKN
ncbi:uncharacterized protein LOC114262724 [Camellia sinensis]|uniref:uncharacterized protein LOC114262724 n=1 Tax=Camellia sinensis TaxID=4442 RepID=UPI001035AAA8|nr:uncharacterized protein LOC114262724 [Camellia sinensis]